LLSPTHLPEDESNVPEAQTGEDTQTPPERVYPEGQMLPEAHEPVCVDVPPVHEADLLHVWGLPEHAEPPEIGQV